MAAEATVGRRGEGPTLTATSVPTRAPISPSTRPLPRRARARQDQRGAVTAEAAAVLPVMLLVTMLMVWLVSVATTQVRVVDAARESARQAARGESVAVAVRHGSRVAPEGATFSVSRSAGQVRVRAAAQVRGPGGLFAFLPGLTVEAETVAVREPR